jgi:hypothetical protein
MITDEEFYKAEKEANRIFREFKRKLRTKFPHLYAAVKQHEKENKENDILMIDLFSSRFGDQVME